MWINQPNMFQPFHALHGRNILVNTKELDDESFTVTVWFTSGNVISQIVTKHCLSKGWEIE